MDLAVTHLHVNFNLETSFAVQVHMSVTLLIIALVLIACVQMIYRYRQVIHARPYMETHQSVLRVRVY